MPTSRPLYAVSCYDMTLEHSPDAATLPTWSVVEEEQRRLAPAPSAPEAQSGVSDRALISLADTVLANER